MNTEELPAPDPQPAAAPAFDPPPPPPPPLDPPPAPAAPPHPAAASIATARDLIGMGQSEEAAAIWLAANCPEDFLTVEEARAAL
jgi:hypothetical protein